MTGDRAGLSAKNLTHVLLVQPLFVGALQSVLDESCFAHGRSDDDRHGQPRQFAGGQTGTAYGLTGRRHGEFRRAPHQAVDIDWIANLTSNRTSEIGGVDGIDRRRTGPPRAERFPESLFITPDG